MIKNKLLPFILISVQLLIFINCITTQGQVYAQTEDYILNKIDGAWVSESDSNWEIFFSDGLRMDFYANNLIDVYDYNITNNCGKETLSEGEYFLKSLNKKDNFSNCLIVEAVDIDNSGTLSFTTERGNLLIFKRTVMNDVFEAYVQPIFYKIFQEQGAKVSYGSSTIIYNSMDRILSSISLEDFDRINDYYHDNTGNSKLTSSMIREVKHYLSSDNASINYFVNWFQKELEKETLDQHGITAVRFEGCLNNADCIVRPDNLFGDFVKYKIEDGMAILDDIHTIVGDLSEKALRDVAASYGYGAANKGVFVYHINKDPEENFDNKEAVIRMQNDFKDKILSYIVPKYANKARFKSCENEYYGCDCIKPCPK